ncbi:sodium:solute symporter family protein [Methyloterricola oryzae]|uniref:sodium:solute symporter family protein n=1 Tax=Methyloterricola oryzae TaxID=1495050 RepID=UPI0005EB13A5|nr:sodium:solute symporter family protein [Methyloterricola oryzae]
MNTTLIGIFAYILLQLLVGVLVSKRIASEDDYLLAGRRLGLGLGTFTVFATWFGAETCIGAAGAVYRTGLSGGSADPFGYAACLLLMGVLFAVPLWRMRLTTLADLFRLRYSPRVEKLVVLMVAPTSIMWAGAQIRAFGQIISASSQFQVDAAITLAAGVVIVYTVYGGLLADVVTDLVQGVALILGLVVLFVVVMQAQGGVSAAFAALEPARLNPLEGNGRSLMEVLEAWAIPVTGSLFAQELVARIVASRSPQVASLSSVAGGAVYLLVGLIPVALGLVGFQMMPELQEPEQILPLLAQKHLGSDLYILFAGALISAILSTVDSALLAASALVSHNVVLPLARDVSEAGKVRIARYCVVLFGLVAYSLALVSEGVHELVEQASAFGGAGVFVVVLFALTTRVGDSVCATGALIAGVTAWHLGRYALSLETPYLFSMALSAATYLVLLARGPIFKSS